MKQTTARSATDRRIPVRLQRDALQLTALTPQPCTSDAFRRKTRHPRSAIPTHRSAPRIQPIRRRHAIPQRLLICCLAAWMMIAPPRRLAADPAAAPAKDVEAIEVAPEKLDFNGQTSPQRLLITGVYSDGKRADATPAASLVSADPSVASVTSDGIVTPHANGTTELRIRFGQQTARCVVRVAEIDAPRPMHFRTEVIAALSRGGCNQGACHGSPQGKNGFRLSLRGFDPAVDLRYLTRDLFGRRRNTSQPESSLMLLKGTGRVAHLGGRRFRTDDSAYQTLRQWIAEGCRDTQPDRGLVRLEVIPQQVTLHPSSPRQQIVARAHYSDGAVQDVTDLAVFTIAGQDAARVDPTGRVQFQGTGEAAVLVRFLDRIQTVQLGYVRHDPSFEFPELVVDNEIDRLVFARQRRLQLTPSRLANDAVFLRRVHLDLLGGIPTADETRSFIDSRQADKRKLLIDQLLERPTFGFFWALKWADVMRGNRETISERGVHTFHRYLVQYFEEDRSMAMLAREILTSQGNTVHVPAANFFRISRTPTTAAESFSQLFLGVRIQCAKCHNHPYESITQRDYYGLSAYFARVRLKGTRFGLDDETVYLAGSGEVKYPVTGDVVVPAAFGQAIGDADPKGDRRQQLANWLTDPDNPWFARFHANRVWAQLLGQGIVEPVDDFRLSNPPSNPELLDALARTFARHDYRMKPLIREILNSRTYQLSMQPHPQQSQFAANPDRYFTRAKVRMLSAEQILDAIAECTGLPEQFPNYPLGTRAIELAEGNVDHKFLQAFTRPIRDVACDCARETEPSLNQVMHLMNNPSLLARLDHPESRLGRMLQQQLPTPGIVERLYLATVNRRPTAAEFKLVQRHLEQADSPERGLRDLQHALINSNEFLFRH